MKAVIFDRDGVLTHFDRPELEAFFEPLVRLPLAELALRWQRWCERGACPRTLAEETEFWAAFWDGVSQELGLAPATRDRLRTWDYTTSIRPFPEARAALAAVRVRGLRVGVLSNFPLASLDASLRAAGVADLVDVACSATLIGAAKPAAPAYLAATRSLGVDPSECLFFDDEPACVEGARAVGLRAFWVDRSRVQHALRERVVRNLDPVAEILDEALARAS